MTIQLGFIDHGDGANLRTLPAEMKGSACLTPAPLPPGTRVSVIRDHAQAPGWSYVSTVVGGYLLQGFIQTLRITTQLPEPAATLYLVRPGDRLEPIAARIYRQAIQPGRDLRFYENVIHHVNVKSGRKGVQSVDGDVRLVAGERIWLVSIAFANQLQGVVSSGSITHEAMVQARKAARHLEDVLASVRQADRYFGEVTGQYGKAILDNWLEISAMVVGFIAAEALSTFLAATPTGVGQLAAALIQLGLAAFGAHGLIEAGGEALKHAQLWLIQAWEANGSQEKLKEASKSFLRMLVSIAMAALALLGVKTNAGRGLKLMTSVRITPPRIYMMAAAGPSGAYAGVPVFQPGSITAAPSIPLPFNPWGSGAPLLSKAVKEGGSSTPEPEPPLTERTLSDAELEKLLEKLPNWDKLKDFVGRRIPQEGTPEFNAFKKELQAAGYRLEKLSSGSQPYRLRRPDGKALGDEYGALTVTDDGLVVLKVGKGTPRLSVFTRYRKNYLDWVEKTQGPAARAAAEVRLSAGHPMHHLIPDGVAQSHPLIRMAMERLKGYTIDRGSNILDMHSGLNVEGQLIHSGSHPFYSNFVNARLDRALSKLRMKGPASSWTPQVIEEAILKVENELRQAIESGSLKEPAIKVIQEQRGGKVLTGRKLALLELRSHGESHTT
ncbi:MULTISPECIES: AHH domain-containing protein [unclassified Corallococcus]|uniref:AHH domain-containing protein n=1 Tax=unclassified Corallococcus TaxID=2685029 RepID=UPI001A90A6FD|nr:MULTISPECIES: AHH domain-containing protein [unclassified Corallococcus]MBN9687746.1 AHH domain-containing protein [Corallococcus sp. NCSPR001]WAS88442.1 AHH domain-containing protein [Corallococcus sp. NCRR]